MIGKIVLEASATAQGLIAGDSGKHYSFTTASWRNQPVGSAVGMRVEFEPRASHAVNVTPDQAGTSMTPRASAGSRPSMPPARAARQPSRSSNASSASSPGSPKPKVQPQPKSSKGSIWAGIRSMSAIFLLTPVSIPLIALLPLLGRIELLTMLTVPGFMGGRRAGSVKKAMAAAVLVGTVYGLVLFVLMLALFKLVTDLPLVGIHLERGLNFIGGLGFSSGLVAAIATAPFVFLLLISALIGALTTRRFRHA